VWCYWEQLREHIETLKNMLRTPIGRWFGNTLGSWCEHIENLMGTWWEHIEIIKINKKVQTLRHCACTFLPQRRKRWVSWVHATTPHWPNKIYIHYCLCHPFLPILIHPLWSWVLVLSLAQVRTHSLFLTFSELKFFLIWQCERIEGSTYFSSQTQLLQFVWVFSNKIHSKINIFHTLALWSKLY